MNCKTIRGGEGEKLLNLTRFYFIKSELHYVILQFYFVECYFVTSYPGYAKGQISLSIHQYKSLHKIFHHQNIHETPIVVKVSFSSNLFLNFGKEKLERIWCSNHTFNTKITNFMTSSCWCEKKQNFQLQIYIPIWQFCVIWHSSNKCQHLLNVPN